MELFVFICATAMVLAGAVGVITQTHPVHAALSLILTLFGVAVHFVALAANFLAAVQVIVYAGAIVVLFLFVIMLLGVDKTEDLRVEPFTLQRPVAVAVGAAVLSFLGIAIMVSRDAATPSVPQSQAVNQALDGAGHDSNIRALARDLFSDHVLAFELTSVLLVIAVVGTVILARKPRKGELA
ncbi:MAG: NADH-quinone oxidoreductase subunit J [Ilumatobacteraceae bacterium]|nr:NADH-quinone oxidoreductase subunit J [Ilumatobacter sp.]